MTEFLTENARRAYPLEREWPSSADYRWGAVIRDACIGFDGILGKTERIYLLAVINDATDGCLKFRIGKSSDSYVDVAAQTGIKGFGVVTNAASSYSGAGQPHYKVFLTVAGPAVDAVVSGVAKSTAWTPVNVPVSIRCVSCASDIVTSVNAYTPEEPCEHTVFTEDEEPICEYDGDIAVKSDPGIDVDTTEVDQIDGEILRVSAITAPADSATSDESVDIMIRGDDCFMVEALPGTKAVQDVSGKYIPEKLGSGEDPLSSGVIRITSKCKPCCQCEDYESATKVLRPHEASTTTINSALNLVKETYEAAIATFNEVKVKALAAVNAYVNVHASATATISGGVYTSSTAKGYRSRIAVTLLVDNMTQENATISSVACIVPGFTWKKTQWSASGTNPRAGSAVSGVTWTLAPGDTLSVVFTYAKVSTTNGVTKPDGMKVTFGVKLPSRSSADPREVPVK